MFWEVAGQQFVFLANGMTLADRLSSRFFLGTSTFGRLI